MLARLLISPFGSPWRLKCLCLSTKNPLLKKILIQLYGLYNYENNSSIAWNSRIAGEPYFPHGPKSVFVSGDARIGRNSVIFQQVTIGSNTLIDSKGMGAPVIGDNCYIGAGAKIIGNVKVGNNVRVGANALVFKDVPDNSVVLCESRIVVKDTTPDNRHYSYAGRWGYWEDAQFHPLTDQDLIARLDRQRK
jgi:serine O-acetyltransferase